MYLRVTAFRSDPGKLDAGTAFFRDHVIPAMRQAPGFLGATEVIDRSTGSGAASTVWESLKAMNDADQAGVQVRIQTAQAIGLEIVDVDRFEIVIFDRREPATMPVFTKLTMAYGDPDRLDAGIAVLRDEVLPVVKAQGGYISASAGVNRMTGRAFTSSSWRTPEEREAADAATAKIRERVAPAGGLYGAQVALCETVVAEVKLPTPA